MKKNILLTLAAGLFSFGLSAQVTTFPWTDDLESNGTCATGCSSTCNITSGMANDLGDIYDWIIDINGTGSSNTGPTANGGADHNPGIAGGKYAYLETSGCAYTSSNLVSPYFDFTNLGTPAVTFWYHMYGAAMGTMQFDVESGGVWTLNVIPAWTDNQDIWQEQTIDLSAYAGQNNIRFRIRGTRGSTFTSDMAVDDFSVYDAVYQIVTINEATPNCPGDSDGTIEVDAVFGTPPYTYNWSNGATGALQTGLPEGIYTVTCTDANGDTTSATYDLTLNAIVSTTTLVQDLICDYDQGVGYVSATGGTPITDSYIWDTTSANFSPDTSMVGTSVFLGDDQVTADLNIGFDFVFFGDTHSTFRISSNGFITFANSTANGCCSGQNLPTGGTPNDLIALVWDDLWGTNGLGQINYYTTGTAPFRKLVVNFISVGYCCSATNSVNAQLQIFETTNCIEIHTIDVINANPATQGIENQNGTEGYTYPGRNASSWSSQGTFISFCAPVGGLSYEWDNGITDTLNPALTIGNNIVTITDANGCEAYDTIVINPPISTLNLDPDVLDISCFGFNDGEIITNETGGVAPVSYAWTSGQTSADIANLVQGTYGVTATDAVGCVDIVDGMMIHEPDIILTSISGVSSPACENQATGSAFVVVQGGRPPYSINWSDGQIGQSATNLTAGNYQVIVTDSTGCQSVQALTIVAENPSPNVDLGPKILSTTGAAVSLNAGTHNSYLWNTNATTQSISATMTGEYWVEVTNIFGCIGSDTIYVEIWPLGVNDIASDSKFALYPNPASTNLMLLLDGNTNLINVNVSITNVQGQVVMNKSYDSISASEQVELDVKDIAPGIYNLSVQSDAYSAVKSFVKQ